MINQEKILNNYRNIVDKIKKIDFTMLNNEELLNKSNNLKELIITGTAINEIVIEGFALVQRSNKKNFRV